MSVREPGYTETDKIIRVQTDIWSTAREGGRLIWSGTLRTMESLNSQTMERAVNRRILPEMEKEGVVPPQPR